VNLRIDAETIRLRLSFEEAKKLACLGELSELLPWAPSNLNLNVSHSDCLTLSFCCNSLGQIYIKVPYLQLNSLLEEIAVSKNSKVGLEIKNKINLGYRQIVFSFEVDRFSFQRPAKTFVREQQ
jgi:hypothetical protein